MLKESEVKRNVHKWEGTKKQTYNEWINNDHGWWLELVFKNMWMVTYEMKLCDEKWEWLKEGTQVRIVKYGNEIIYTINIQ